MKNSFVIFLLLLAACKKEAVEKLQAPEVPIINDTAVVYTKYIILKGTHYSNGSSIRAFAGNHINFNVKFDSTAIYQTINPANQGDINKLYGFTEGIDNHLNSARIGWSWNNNALRLYAYVYADSVRSFKQISAVRIGQAVSCSISISGNRYLFFADGKNVELPRVLNSAAVEGYWQYPYFGGDETAPHNINIYMLNIEN